MLLAVFVGAIFVSAALLFAVQPMFTKMVLPRLGGAPAVWSVAMVFFQAVLLAGYAYAHALTRFVPARRRWSSRGRDGRGDDRAAARHRGGLGPATRGG